MAIIVEHIDKSGHVLRWQKFDHDQIALGRAFDNDLIMADLSVDAHHALVTWSDELGSLQIQDLGAVNGLWVFDARGKKNRYSHGQIQSGQKLLLGKTLLRLYHSSHPVPAATHARLDEVVTGFFGHLAVVVALAFIAIGLDVWSQYLDHPVGQHYGEFGREALYGVLGVCVYSGFWALLGKSLLQDGRFWFHLSLSFLVLILWMLWEFYTPWLMFNLQIAALVMGWMNKLVASILAGGAIYISCLYATRLGQKPRLAISAILPLIIMAPLVVKLFDKREFSMRPNYSHVLVAPASQWRSPDSFDDFMKNAETVYKTYDPATETDDGDTDEDAGNGDDNPDDAAPEAAPAPTLF